MDAAAFCGLMLLMAAAAWLARSGDPAPAPVLLYAFGGLLFVTSKTQHAIWMLLPAAYLVYLSLQWRRNRLLGLIVAALLVIGGGLELATADPGNRAQALFNKLFFQIGQSGPDGPRILQELGVAPDELKYIGTHSYVADSPAGNFQWVVAFYSRTGYPRLLAWYARHPGRAVAMLWRTLATDAGEMRQSNLSNYRRQDGHRPGERTGRFALWSGFRGLLLVHWPAHLLVWYALFMAGCIAAIRRGAARFGWLGLMVAALGLGQFAVASLADCLETARHLFLFQVATDLTICIAVTWAVYRYFTNKTALPRSL
jgi:hypothetical protein